MLRLVAAGDNVPAPKIMINEENCYFAIFADTEGNTMGLWSMK